MNIVFLDIDGVLNSHRSFVARVGKNNVELDDSLLSFIVSHTISTIDPVACGLINTLLTRRNAKIVLSSSHRSNFLGEDEEAIVTKLKKYLTALGVDGDKCIARTPVLHICRGGEIATWIKQNEEKYPISNYVIIDDMADMLPEQNNNFVQTDEQYGFSIQDYIKAAQILGEKDRIDICL